MAANLVARLSRKLTVEFSLPGVEKKLPFEGVGVSL
jgi:hypothetical protein